MKLKTSAGGKTQRAFVKHAKGVRRYPKDTEGFLNQSKT